MTYLADRDIAPPGQEGWTRHQEKYREASFDGADGVVVQDQTEMFLYLNHHPVCAASDASHFLLTGAATPPGQEGRWPGYLLLVRQRVHVHGETRLRGIDFRCDGVRNQPRASAASACRHNDVLLAVHGERNRESLDGC